MLLGVLLLLALRVAHLVRGAYYYYHYYRYYHHYHYYHHYYYYYYQLLLLALFEEPTLCWSRDCELMKANFACGIESEHLSLGAPQPAHLSPVISLSLEHSQIPTTLSFLRISCHWSYLQP